MIAILGVLTLFFAPVALIITIIQAIRKKSYKKWLVIFGICCVCFTVCLVVDIDNVSPTIPIEEKPQISEETKPTDEPIIENESTETPVPETEAEKFAKSNDISVELAQSMEYVLGEVGYSLSQAYNLEQTDDWAYGRRYKVWIDMEYICFFYCQDEEVVSLRRSNGDFVWQAETEVINMTTVQSNEILTAEELHKNANSYEGQYVYVTGKIILISEFSDMNGYYLYGTRGDGLVCWVDETSKCANIGDEVIFYGLVREPSFTQVELAYCKLYE